MASARTPSSGRRLLRLAHGAALGLLVTTGSAIAGEPESSATGRQSLDDAWWTGPIVASGAGTLPHGHALVEPYLFDVIRTGRYDTDGHRQSADRDQFFGSLTYILYGITDRFTAGLVPTFGFNDLSNGRDSSSIQIGDVSVLAQYRLSQFHEGSRVPTASLFVQETLPTGKYDRLGSNPADGIGAGAHTTTVALYLQYYFWMPNGRILRTRFDLSQSFSNTVDVRDVSVYGTSAGFRGRAAPGNQLTLNPSLEYSITRNWVFALDLVYQRDDTTRLRGVGLDPVTSAPVPVDADFGSAWRFGVVPAIEYNWSGAVGLIVGARWFAAGRNTSATLTPAIALNMVY